MNNLLNKISNFKFYKKFLSMLTAGMMFTTPVAGLSESIERENNDTFTLQKQMVEYKPLNINEYTNKVGSAYHTLTPKINYNNMQLDLQCLYYMAAREYMPKEDEQELLNNGIIYDTDVVNGKFENFNRAYNIINVINDYNQSVVRKTNDINYMIDPSILCYDENEAKLVNNMFVNYFNAYQETVKAYDASKEENPSLIENESYNMVFKQLTTLNAYEKAGNAAELNVGPTFVALNIVGGEVMQLLRDYMQNKYSREELDKYFVPAELNKGQWILRDDISLDLNCLKNELEVIVAQFGQLWSFVYDHVNDDMMKSFEVDCKTK